MNNVYLVLESGQVLEGVGFAPEARAGELVFNTSHFGYEEIATDPSYFNQIVVMTSPMQGNYGVDDLFWESKKIHISGFCCLQIQQSSRDSSWMQRLKQNKVPLFTEFDSRQLTLYLRQQGTVWAALCEARNQQEALEFGTKIILQKKSENKDWVSQVTCKDKYSLSGAKKNGLRVAVFDFGSKSNILRLTQEYCESMQIFSSRASFSEINRDKPQALILTNGPGDPSDVQNSVDVIRQFIGKIPIFGICMGHQLLSLALGAKTYKLKFGHRGSNHPIQDKLLNKIYMTSQNHGYAVDEKTLPNDVQVTHTNLTDGTCAGISSLERKILSVQFHPESRPGPHDSEELFDYFFTKRVM